MRGSLVSSPREWEEFHLNREALPLLECARSLGMAVVVVTNQPDIERGLLTPETLERIHQALVAELPIDAIETCPAGHDGHPRRKPNPGMLLDAARRDDLDLARSWMIGDSLKDILAGQRAGVTTILLRTSYNRSAWSRAEHDVESLEEAAGLLRKAPQ